MKKYFLMFGLLVLGLSVIWLISTNPEKDISTNQLKHQVENTTNTYCHREKQFSFGPKIQDAISIVYHRNNDDKSVINQTIADDIEKVYNCLKITYASQNKIKGAEGVFYMDTATSNNNQLVINVLDSYKGKHVLLLSSVLAHEIEHAVQFVKYESYIQIGKNCAKNYSKESCSAAMTELANYYVTDCVGLEAEAFEKQFHFISTLSDGEITSLANLITNSPQDQQVYNLNYLLTNMGLIAKQWSVVGTHEGLKMIMRNFVSTIPAYQKECKLG